jgi:SulP family sulfate permease
MWSATGPQRYTCVFFGTTAALASRIEDRLEDESEPPLAFAALDFAQVTDMDSSAALSFMKLAQEAAKSNFFLVLTGLSPAMEERLKGSWFETETTSYVQIMPDLDRGVEWCEERMLREQELAEEDYESLMDRISRYLPSPADYLILQDYLERRTVEPGEELATQGEPSDEMFLLQSCTPAPCSGRWAFTWERRVPRRLLSMTAANFTC